MNELIATTILGQMTSFIVILLCHLYYNFKFFRVHNLMTIFQLSLMSWVALVWLWVDKHELMEIILINDEDE